MSCLSNSSVLKTSKELNKDKLEAVLLPNLQAGFRIQDLKFVKKSSEFNNENFQSDIKRIEIKSNDGQNINIVIKETMNGSPYWLRTFLSFQRPFFRECIWYEVAIHLLSEAWPIIKDLSPKCYYTYYNSKLSLKKSWIWKKKEIRPAISTKPEKSLILLENVTLNDDESARYAYLDISVSIDPNVAVSALRSLGHFHGIWWQFLNEKNSKFPNNPGFTPEDFKFNFQSNDDSNFFMTFVKPFFKMYKEVLLNHVPGTEGKDLAERLWNYFTRGKMFQICKKILLMTISDKSQYKTMIHGDFWRNNLLWRPSDNHIMPIDYQTLIIAHPGRDFWYFIYSSSDRDWRHQHLEECKREYYKIYSSYLEEHIDIDYNNFCKELEEIRGSVLFTSMALEILSKYPKEIDKNSMVIIGRQYKQIFKNIKSEKNDSDHPAMQSIRECLIDTARDMKELNII